MQRKTARHTGIRLIALGATTLALGIGGAGSAFALDIPVNVNGVVNAKVSTTSDKLLDVNVPLLNGGTGTGNLADVNVGDLPDVNVLNGGLPDVNVLNNNGRGTNGNGGGGTDDNNNNNNNNNNGNGGGTNGKNGDNGKNGTNGGRGSSGTNGSNGSNGSNGRDGSSGGVYVIGGGSAGGTSAGRSAGAAGSASGSANGSANGAANGSANGQAGANGATDGTGTDGTSSLSTDGDRLTAGSTGHHWYFWVLLLLVAAAVGGAIAWGAGRYRRYQKDRALRRRMSRLAREMHEEELIRAGAASSTK